ncbi:hypothetical protein [Ideonella sp.]|uniref:hypothetical protein n=1 Tax=Ideonella sp. TaxID=1929293 RepID=UPI0035B3FAC9
MSRQLYLHIGQTKTGSTSLQTFLHTNRQALRQQGILYPMMPAGEVARIQHRFLVHSLHAAGEDHWRAAPVWAPFFKALHGQPEPTAIVSEETFWHLFEHRSDRRTGAIRWVAQMLSDFEVKVVVYLRRQDQWVESWFNQVARAPVRRAASALTFDEFVQRQHRFGLFDYAAILDDWATAFGRDAIEVRTFEREALTNANVVDDFCGLVGIEATADFAPAWQAQRRLSPATCRFANLFNRWPDADPSRAAFLGALRGVSDFAAAPASKLLSNADAHALVERYAGANQRVAAEYLGGRPLFTPVDQDDRTALFGGASADEVAALAIRLFVAQQRETDDLRQQVAALSDRLAALADPGSPSPALGHSDAVERAAEPS